MSEICSECLRKEVKSFKNKEFVLSKELDICESCGQWKNVVIRVKEPSILDDIQKQFRKMFKKN